MTSAVNWTKVKNYIIAVLVPVALGAAVGLLTSRFMDYDMLEKPALAPPGWLFPVMWSILYVLMGVSYGMLKNKGALDFNVMSVYYGQLAVNLLWPIFFFIFKWRLFSFIWIVALAILVITMAVRFYKKDNTAGLLQIPYAAWVVFASYLNFMIFVLNG